MDIAKEYKQNEIARMIVALGAKSENGTPSETDLENDEPER